MKNITKVFMAASILCLLSIGIAANDKELKERMTFTQEIWVNNTLVEPGDYLIRYDATTGMVRIMEGDDVVAQARATVTVNDDEFDQDAVLLTTTSKGAVLTGLRLGGQREEIHISDATAEISFFDFNKYHDFNLGMGW